MGEALTVAGRIPRRPWPNPPVGAVVVRDGRVVGRGCHHGPGEAHAERVALAEAGAAARGATLYCTLEPCNHTGRTGPCAPAVVASGVSRVVLGVRDPNPQVAGAGASVLRQAGIEVCLGVRGDEALELIWPFVVTDAFRRPFVELKTATSLDDCFTPGARPAAQPVGARYLTGLPARRDVHVRRRWLDLVLVGERTASEDRPALDGRLVTADDVCPDADPAAGYVDTDSSYTAGLPRSAYYVFAGEDAPERSRSLVTEKGATVVTCATRDGHVDPVALLEQLVELDLRTVMVEGGPRLASAFLRAGCVDRWVRYLAPTVFGNGVRWPRDLPPLAEAVRGFSLTRSDRVGDDLRLVCDRLNFADTLTRVTGESSD